MLQRLATLIILLMAGLPLSAQWLDLSTPGIPRTADNEPDLTAPVPKDAYGQPNLSGLWIPVNSHGSLFDPNNAQEWARELMAEHESNYYGQEPRFSCLPGGPAAYPAGALAGGLRRFVHRPDFLAILNADMTYRQVFMDGRELETDPFPTWTGYSVGYWEGDSLVVESNGYNDKTWLNGVGLQHTDQLRITERYQRVDFGHINIEITYDDPGTFTESVQAFVEMEYRADTEILENVCNESSKGLSHWNGEVKQADAKVVEVPEEVLETYVGTYEGIWLGNTITAEIVLEDGEMSLIRTPPYAYNGGNVESAKSRLIAQSQTAFDCTCGVAFVFKANDEGMVNDLEEVHVSGAWSFKRVR
ncbi:MAG TPA: hypothetical protein DCY55_07040 [Gammaproteobacteria bacterium]|nr:hypothetical protein [Gammaproteobacteria bacterium]